MSAVIPHDTFGFAGGTGCVEHVQRIGGDHRYRIDRCGACHQLRPVEVPAGGQLAEVPIALDDDTRIRVVLRQFQRVVKHRLVRDDSRRLDAARCRDDNHRPGIVDAAREFVAGEPAEHHRVHGAESRAGQHRNDGFGDHRHVEDHAIALTHTEATQYAGETRGLGEQLAIGEGALGPGHR